MSKTYGSWKPAFFLMSRRALLAVTILCVLVVASTALAATMPGTNGGQRQIQFAVRFMF